LLCCYCELCVDSEALLFRNQRVCHVGLHIPVAQYFLVVTLDPMARERISIAWMPIYTNNRAEIVGLTVGFWLISFCVFSDNSSCPVSSNIGRTSNSASSVQCLRRLSSGFLLKLSRKFSHLNLCCTSQKMLVGVPH
jgi:hypothetical protein